MAERTALCIPSSGADPPSLGRVRLHSLYVLPVASGRGSWSLEITPLLYARLWCLTPLRNLVSQADSDILHPRPAELDLGA